MAYHEPRKVILSHEQLAFFQSSKVHQDIISYIETLNESVVGGKLTDECSESQVSLLLIRSRTHSSRIRQGVKAILDVLSKVEEMAKDTPPVENSGSRFGNPAFRTFYDKVAEVKNLLFSSWFAY